MRNIKRSIAVLICLAVLCTIVPMAVFAAETDAAKILNDAYALASGDVLPYEATLTGKVISVDEVYSSQYKNITVTIEVPGYADKPVKCYRMTGTGTDEVDIGYTITVTGNITKYYETVEFANNKNQGMKCELVAIVQRGAQAPEDPKQIVDAAFALAPNATLPYTATLTGKVVEIVDPYSDQYKNITLVIEVEGSSGMKTIECYRMTGEGAETIKVGDMISVTGILKHYYKEANDEKPELSKIEFDAKCSFVFFVPTPEDPKQIVDDAFALAPGASLPYTAVLTGKVTEIVEPYNDQYKNITLVIEVEGSSGKKTIECYHLGGEGVDQIVVGDTIKVEGLIKRFSKDATDTLPAVDKIEFDSAKLLSRNQPVDDNTPGGDTDNNDGNTTPGGDTGNNGGNTTPGGNTGNNGGNTTPGGNTGNNGGNTTPGGNTGNTGNNGGNTTPGGNTGNNGGNTTPGGNTGNNGGNTTPGGNTGNNGGNTGNNGGNTGNNNNQKPSVTLPKDNNDSVVTLFVKVPATWATVNAYAWSDSANDILGTWPGKAMTEKDGDWYKIVIPAPATGIVINNGADQTGDLTVKAGKDVYITVNNDNTTATVMYADGSVQGGNNTSMGSGEAADEDIKGTESAFRVVGNADWMGNWDAASDAGRMLEVSPGVYKQNFENVQPGNYELKITQNGTWDRSWGDNGNNFCFTILEACTITVTFTLNGEVGTISVKGLGVENAKTADISMISVYVLMSLAMCAAGILIINKKKFI